MGSESIYIKVGQYDSVFKKGNMKLPKSTLVFNLCSATDCPSKRLGFCQAVDAKGKNICYALQAETQYNGVKAYRDRQTQYWDDHTAEEFVAQVLRIRGVDALRVDEAGDFRSQADVDKLQAIAKMLRVVGIRTYVYTARRYLNYANTPDLVVMGSGFKKEGINGMFTMILDKKDKPKGFGLCPADCRKCDRCLRGLDTANLAHGPLIR